MPLSWQPDDVNLGDLGDLDVTTPADGDTLIFDDATGTWQSGQATVDLSDVDPQPVENTPDAGVSSEASRSDHTHALGVLDEFVMSSPDGTLWTFTVDDTGALSSTSLSYLLTESGDTLTTESGDLILLES